VLPQIAEDLLLGGFPGTRRVARGRVVERFIARIETDRLRDRIPVGLGR
jgi:hypothetical protein